MSDPAPNKFMPTGPAGPTAPGAYVVPLARARFIMKGQFFHPIKETDEPLPPHQFYLFCVSNTAVPSVMGEPSQSDGVSWINYTLDLEEEVPGTTWALGWRPLVAKPNGAFAPTADAGKGEAWLDLEKMQWVDFKDVGFVDKRKLLRIPLWASHLKAKQGGFKEFPKKTKFGNSGLLVYDNGELNPYGEPKKPWVVQVDQGLFRAYVRFVYYDPKEKKTKPVPPGLVVHAIGTRALSGPATGTESRVAAGTALDDDGTLYMLHERTKANLANSSFGYFFFTGTSGTGQHGIIDFAKVAAKDKVATVAVDPSAKRVERYILPREWHSKGMEAWTQEDGKGLPQRKPFASLRTADTTKAQPLRFHLDDAILAAGPVDAAPVKKDARVTLFDHLLHIRDADDKKPHYWKTKLAANYLRAEDAVFVAGEGVDKMTRVIFMDGVVFELRETRLQAASGASFGKVDCIGARAAITSAFDDKHRRVSYMSGNPSMPEFNQVKGRTVQHLIDVSDDVPHTVDGKSVKLLNLLTWVPIFFENKIGGDGEKAMAQLERAAERLNQTHPGHPSQPPANRKPAEFVLAPDGAITDGARIVRVRHFFAEVPATFTDAVKILFTKSANSKARAGASSTDKLVTMYKGDIAPCYAPDGEPGQDAATSRFTLAHELGHILGFPDEYIEIHPTLGEDYAAWDQYAVDAAQARPFDQDGPSLMESNNKPRLRHYWHYANDLAIQPDFVKMIDAKPYLPINLAPATGGKLVYERPFTEMLPGQAGPYTPVFPCIYLGSGITRCDASVFRLGTDEGTIERSFKKAPADVDTKMADAKVYDGLAFIRIKFMVRIDPSIDNKVMRAKVFTGLRNLVRRGQHFSKQFAIELEPATPKAGRSHDKPHLRRIFVCFSPEFDITSRYTGAKPPEAVPAGHHIFLDIVKTRATPHPLLSATPPTPLPLLVTEIDESILLYAVGQPTFTEDASTHVKTLRTTLAAADMQFFADNLHGYLNDNAAPLRKMKDT